MAADAGGDQSRLGRSMSGRRDPAAEGRETDWPPAAAAEPAEPPPDIPQGDDLHDPAPPADGAFAVPAPAAGVPPADFTMPPPAAGGLEDAAACPAFEGGVIALVYQLQAQFQQHRQDSQEFRQASMRDRADMRRLLEQHTRDERPRLSAIQTRLNVCMAMVLAVGLFALAGPEGLRQIGDAVSRGGALGVDGMVTLAGAAIPLLYPFGRLIFLRIDNDRPARSAAGNKESDPHG